MSVSSLTAESGMKMFLGVYPGARCGPPVAATGLACVNPSILKAKKNSAIIRVNKQKFPGNLNEIKAFLNGTSFAHRTHRGCAEVKNYIKVSSKINFCKLGRLSHTEVPTNRPSRITPFARQVIRQVLQHYACTTATPRRPSALNLLH